MSGVNSTKYDLFKMELRNLLLMMDQDSPLNFPIYQEIAVRLHTGNPNKFWSDRVIEQFHHLQNISKWYDIKNNDMFMTVKHVYQNRTMAD
jgi:hypothetical protein